MVYVHQGKNYLARKKEWVPMMSATWVQLEGITKSTRYRKTNSHLFSPMCGGQNTGLKEVKNRRVVAIAWGGVGGWGDS